MDELLKEQEALEKLELSKTNPSQRILQDIRTRITRLKEGIDGWQKQIDRVDDLYKNAGKDSSIKPVTNLVSNQLLQKDGKDSVTRANGSKADNANEIRDISAISFVGGGSSITYSEELANEITKWNGSTVAGSRMVGVKTDHGKSLTAFLLSFSFQALAGSGSLDADSKGSSQSVSREQSLTLSDPDDGDSFDVKVYRDPVYGSFFFVTASGFSRFDSVQNTLTSLFRCMWEANTVRREKVNLEYASGDGVKRQILPEEPAVFEVLA